VGISMAMSPVRHPPAYRPIPTAASKESRDDARRLWLWSVGARAG
jgi:hypothetical protein